MPDTAPEPTEELAPAAPEPPEPPAPPEPLAPPEPPRPLPWWAPGLAVGLLAAVVAGVSAVGPHGPPGSHKAIARVQARAPAGESAADADRQVAFLFRTRDVWARVLAAPPVAELDAVRDRPDPARDFEARLAVEPADGFVTVSLAGSRPDDLKTILDELVRQVAEEFAAVARKARDDRAAHLEQLAAALRLDLDRQQEAVELVARANGTTGPGDPGGSGALLRDRLVQAEGELARETAAVALLARQADALKERAKAGAAPDPVEEARLVDSDPRVSPLVAQRAEAAVAVEKERAATGAAPSRELTARLERAEKALAAAREPVRKEAEALLREADARRAARELADVAVRLAVARGGLEATRRERDALGKSLAASHAGGLSVEGMRRALAPQQEAADRTAAELIRLRGAGDGRLAVAEPAFAERVPGRWHWGAALRAAAEAFATAFALVTGFRLAGLTFRAIGEKADASDITDEPDA